MASWFRLARRGAANEFGRRLWRWFAAFELIRWLARRVLPTLLILVALAVAVWLAVRAAGWWLPRLTALAAIAGTLAAAVWLARRYRWELRAGLPRTAVAALALVVAGVLGTAVYHLR
ncbi:hypothetical protein RB614_20335 [Phytohabitans sp. ZYX-F-186]|uniref:DUF202 domain-containing protein n=1 Tax=Phytohabitans maris TaxID=3071409 RepID=A0ABU0ZIL0_9ACTN|nr:hypothetical protein [Phytohabitans sp. ZYX-F-186]MDQ7906867.1 hypothetical protein [Phytohabitans sp. ZYX-F-186]